MMNYLTGKQVFALEYSGDTRNDFDLWANEVIRPIFYTSIVNFYDPFNELDDDYYLVEYMMADDGK